MLRQRFLFALISFLTIVFMSMLAYSTVYGREGLANSVSFLQAEVEQLKIDVGPWFGTLFWLVGAISLFAAALGIVDYTNRLAADVLKTSYLRKASENRLYFGLVWGLVILGCTILLAGFSQPLVLLVISACVGGGMMFIYSILLIVLNRGALPDAIKPAAWRVGTRVWSTLFFGTLAALTIWQQLARFR